MAIPENRKIPASTQIKGLVESLENIVAEEDKLNVSAIQNFNQEVEDVINLQPLIESINLNTADLFNLNLIKQAEKRAIDLEDTIKRKVHFRDEIVSASDDLHIIPFAINKGILPSIYPTSENAEWQVTSEVRTIIKLVDRVPRIVTIPANDPEFTYDPITKKRYFLNEPAREYRVDKSEDFENWTKTFTTVETTTIDAPVYDLDGNPIKYFKIVETIDSGNHTINNNMSTTPWTDHPYHWCCVVVRKETLVDRTFQFRLSGFPVNTRVFFDPATGTFPRASDNIVKTEVIDLGTGWLLALMVDSSAGTGNVEPRLGLWDGTTTSSYVGDITKSVHATACWVVGVDSINADIPPYFKTTSTKVTRAADQVNMLDWKTKNFMGASSGRVTTTYEDDTVDVELWEDGNYTLNALAPVVQAIPDNYTMRNGKIKSVRIKKLSDVPVDPTPPASFSTMRAFAGLYNAGAGVDGGGSATVQTFSVWNDAIEAMQLNDTPAVIHYIGADFDDTVDRNIAFNRSNKTLYATNGQLIQNGEWRVNDCDNVIIRNFKRKKSHNDLIQAQRGEGLWFDHLDLDGEAPLRFWSLGGSGQVVDGLLDLTNQVNLVNVTNCKFSNHNKTLLIGGSDSTTADIGRLDVFIQGNHFYNCQERMPRTRYGRNHAVNNYYHIVRYPIRAGIEGKIISESNYFDDVVELYKFDPTAHFIVDRNNFVDNLVDGSTRNGSGTQTWEYTDSYNDITIISPQDAKAYIEANAGATFHIV